MQADTLIPNPGDPVAYDRYAYVRNNPVKYTDPSGHRKCTAEEAATGDETCEQNYDPDEWKQWVQLLYILYGWNIIGNWTMEELTVLYETAENIIDYVDGFTDGMGDSWFQENMGDVTFKHGGLPGNRSFAFEHTINMVPNWLSDDNPLQYITHELSHIWDIRTGRLDCQATWCGGGAADALATYVGGDPGGVRWANGTSGIPDEYQWNPRKSGGGYGNHSTADYFAESFGWMIYDVSAIPQQDIVFWIQSFIWLQVHGR